MELAVAIVIIAILFAMFMKRVTRVEAAAEKSILQATYQDMQSRLITLKVSLVFQENHAEPLQLIDIARHLGRGILPLVELAVQVNWEDVPRGSWVYLMDMQRFEYRVINEDYFAVEVERPKRVRFQLEPRYVDVNRNGTYDESQDRLQGAVLKLLDETAFTNVVR